MVDMLHAASAMPRNKAEVLPLAHSADSKVRLRALQVLSVCGDPDCRAEFVRSLSDPQERVRLLAMSCLARFPVKSARQRLRAFASSKVAAERAYALAALMRIRDDQDLDLAFAHVSDPSSEVVAQAFGFLCLHPSARAIAFVSSMAPAKDESFDVYRKLALTRLRNDSLALRAAREITITRLSHAQQIGLFDFIDAKNAQLFESTEEACIYYGDYSLRAAALAAAPAFGLSLEKLLEYVLGSTKSYFDLDPVIDALARLDTPDGQRLLLARLAGRDIVSQRITIRAIAKRSSASWLPVITAGLPTLDKDRDLSMLASLALRNLGDTSKRAMEVQSDVDGLSRSPFAAVRLDAGDLCSLARGGWLATTTDRLRKDSDLLVRLSVMSVQPLPIP